METFILILIWFVISFFVSEVAYKKGRSKILWFIYGIVVWPIALIHAYLLEDKIRFKEKIIGIND